MEKRKREREREKREIKKREERERTEERLIIRPLFYVGLLLLQPP